MPNIEPRRRCRLIEVARMLPPWASIWGHVTLFTPEMGAIQKRRAAFAASASEAYRDAKIDRSAQRLDKVASRLAFSDPVVDRIVARRHVSRVALVRRAR
jgi:hypothetical protein